MKFHRLIPFLICALALTGPTSGSADVQSCLLDYIKSITETKLSEDLVKKSLPGDKVVALLSEDPAIKKLFEENPGIRDFATLKEHTVEALKVFEEQDPRSLIDDVSKASKIDLTRLLKLTLALHDIGKPIAADHGEVTLQHAYTVPIVRKVFERLGLSEPEVNLASALVDNDVLGDLLQGNITREQAYKDLRRLASKTPLSTQDFFKLQTLYYTSDAGSYESLRGSLFTKSKGKLTIQDPGYLALKKMTDEAPPKLKEHFEISKEELAHAFTPFQTRLIDFDNYRADEETLAAFRKKYPDVRRYAKNGYAADYKLAFGRSLPEHPDITPEELSVIESYRTGKEGNYDWVRALYTRDPSEISEYELEIKVLASALNKLPSYSGDTYRFVTLPASAVERYKTGDLIFEPSFVSSSVKKRDLDYDSSNTYFEFHLHSQGGHYIDFLNSAESEVLINPNTPFKVMSVKNTDSIPGVLSKNRRKMKVVVLDEISKTDLALTAPANLEQIGQIKERRRRVRKLKFGSSIPTSLWTDGKDILYFTGGSEVNVSGRNRKDAHGHYSIKGSKIIIDLPEGPLVLKRQKNGALMSPDGAEFAPE